MDFTRGNTVYTLSQDQKNSLFESLSELLERYRSDAHRLANGESLKYVLARSRSYETYGRNAQINISRYNFNNTWKVSKFDINELFFEFSKQSILPFLTNFHKIECYRGCRQKIKNPQVICMWTNILIEEKKFIKGKTQEHYNEELRKILDQNNIYSMLFEHVQQNFSIGTFTMEFLINTERLFVPYIQEKLKDFTNSHKNDINQIILYAIEFFTFVSRVESIFDEVLEQKWRDICHEKQIEFNENQAIYKQEIKKCEKEYFDLINQQNKIWDEYNNIQEKIDKMCGEYKALCYHMRLKFHQPIEDKISWYLLNYMHSRNHIFPDDADQCDSRKQELETQYETIIPKYKEVIQMHSEIRTKISPIDKEIHRLNSLICV